MLIRKLFTGQSKTMGTSGTTSTVVEVAAAWRWRRSKLILINRTAITILFALALLANSVLAEAIWDRCEPCSCRWIGGKKAAECLNKSLSSIPRNLSSDLQVVDLSFNTISEIRNNEFIDANLQHMHKLFMRNCKLELLNRDALSGLSILIELDLSQNLLTKLQVGLFSQLEKLRTLVLNKNEIERLDDHLFDNLRYGLDEKFG